MTPEASRFYADNGYLVQEDALSAAEVQSLREETLRLARNEDGAVGGVEPAPAGMDDVEALRRVLCIHFPHKLNRAFRDALAHPAIVDVLTHVVSPNVKAMQSMLFVKASGKPGQAWHQDEDYIPTRDRSLVGAWIALDDATTENGCLWIVPGSNRGVLWPQRWHDDERFDCAWEAHDFPYSDEDAVPVEVRAGSIVFFNGYTLHRSLPNVSRGAFRRALVNHYMSAESVLPWRLPQAGERMATADFRDIVMVAGEDPYAVRGTEELSRSHVRAAGDGGCLGFGGPDNLG